MLMYNYSFYGIVVFWDVHLYIMTNHKKDVEDTINYRLKRFEFYELHFKK